MSLHNSKPIFNSGQGRGVGRGGGKLSPLTVLQMNDKLINSLFFFSLFKIVCNAIVSFLYSLTHPTPAAYYAFYHMLTSSSSHSCFLETVV